MEWCSLSKDRLQFIRQDLPANKNMIIDIRELPKNHPQTELNVKNRKFTWDVLLYGITACLPSERNDRKGKN